MNRRERRAEQSQGKGGSASPGAQNPFGDALRWFRLGQLDEAERCCRQILASRGRHADSLHLLGMIARRRGRPDQAAELFRRAIASDAGIAAFHLNLGSLLAAQGQLDDAAACFRRAVALRPDDPDAHFSLGSALAAQGRPDEAIAGFRRTLHLAPAHAGAHNHLGSLLMIRGQADEGLACFRNAVACRPDYPEAHYNLGNALAGLWQLDEAISSFRAALALRPDYPEAYTNLGNALRDHGLPDAALAHYEKAFQARPGDPGIWSNKLLMQNYVLDQPAKALRDMAREFGVHASARATRPFTRWRDASPGQPLRVGMVSADLGNHPVGYFLEGLLAAVDPAVLSLVAFPSGPGEDELTRRIRPRFSDWKPIHALDDEAAARLIHAQGVQVLLDLSGHTAGNRLPLFAWRPAPVQATWLGYFATTGMAEIDAIMGDPTVTPPEEADHFTETVWSLPEIYYCFTPPAAETELSELPARVNGYPTFGCFNNLAKLNDAVITLWSRVLDAVPSGRLMLKAPQLRSESVRSRIRDRFAVHGIATERLLLEPPSSRAEYLRAYHAVDIALDPFPYPGGATSCEALWMGVPVLTKRGDRFLSHAGETILRNAGLPDWIAADETDYVDKAARFASDPDQLARLRSLLRTQVLHSPLFDAPRFARHFEDALRGMWNRWLATARPGSPSP
jgi:protein O-GlcNAc transferase